MYRHVLLPVDDTETSAGNDRLVGNDFGELFARIMSPAPRPGERPGASRGD